MVHATPMAEPTIDQMLENCRTAMNNLLACGGVQAYTVNTGSGSRSLQHYSLDQLLAMERTLLARKAAETSGNNRIYGTFVNPE